ncbi:Uncharacterized protein FWK35_00000783 [Aphis craccivora]|uniref:Uncharacterized protein n=1 Tax=Aphis craccivora TaxID=307492 RepID=A0A6G0ZM51_APHCR|nr:Uncharacterized protein FWK35_00000783 [Aphis craccivora]
MAMDTDKIDINSELLKIPYVLLERCTLEEINGYKWIPEKNAYYLIEPESEKINEEEVEDNDELSLNLKSILEQIQTYTPYVMLERLSPNDIQYLLLTVWEN